tara:strand:+ start:196 stop:1770 length:1575 start_codon:yes stop_codon:yes gene_type:complete
MDGSFAPLNGFMSNEDYLSVIKNMRLSNGKLFPIPITLDVSEDFAKEIRIGEKVLLRDKEGFKVAYINVDSIWKPDFEAEAELVYGTSDLLHPAVFYMSNFSGEFYIGGRIEKIKMPNHYDFKNYRLDPKTVKMKFKKLGWEKIVAFQTRNPMHRAHVEMTLRSMTELDAKLLLHPVIGPTKQGDIDYFTRVRCYEHVIRKYPKNSVMLGLLPLAMRMGGPKEALLHAIIRKNYGCTHIVIGRDHAGPGTNNQGEPFYEPFEAQDLLFKYQKEIDIKMVPFNFMVYVPSKNLYKSIDEIVENEDYKTISGTELRNILNNGEKIPDWFTYAEVSKELIRSMPPLSKRGFTIFFTGLSGSGKSTIANGILTKLLEEGSRPVTLLDGDIVRTKLSSELGFSKKHRSINVQRIGYVASEITKNGGIAICAPIAPYKRDRDINRRVISQLGGYIEVYINTPLSSCEKRDSKGLYKLAREGKIRKFTGVSDPYEKPENPEIVINSNGSVKPEILVKNLYNKLVDIGYLKA